MGLLYHINKKSLTSETLVSECFFLTAGYGMGRIPDNYHTLFTSNCPSSQLYICIYSVTGFRPVTISICQVFASFLLPTTFTCPIIQFPLPGLCCFSLMIRKLSSMLHIFQILYYGFICLLLLCLYIYIYFTRHHHFLQKLWHVWEMGKVIKNSKTALIYQPV